MKISRGIRVLAATIVALAVVCAWVWARSPTRVSHAPAAVLQIDTGQPGKGFDLGAVGLSIEAFELSSVHLSAEHYRLVRLMRMLGPSVLRIGGDSVDRSWWTSAGEPPPTWANNTVTPADLSALHRLLAATGWRVLLGVDLGHFEPARVANEAHYAQEIVGTKLVGIEIGNEPDDFGKKQELRPPTYTIGEYISEAESYRRAILSSGVNVYGPAMAHTEWLTQMGSAASMFSGITLHYYPSGACEGLGSSAGTPPPNATELLLPAVREQEEETVQALINVGDSSGRPTWIGETNAAACPTSPSDAPVFESSLWALDWALRAISGGVSHIDFHGGFYDCAPHSDSPLCASSQPAARAGEITAQPEYYGLLAARQLEGGQFVPTRLIASDPLPNLTAWATLAPDGVIKIAIDNLAIEGNPQSIAIARSGYTIMADTLTGPSPGASRGVSLGNEPVTSGGEWHPRPKQLRMQGSIRVVVPSASAMIITLRPRRAHR